MPAAVLAIYLSDVGPDDGALGVWPHLLPRLEEYGRRWLAEPGFDLDRTHYRALMEEAVQLAPRRVTGEAGTAFLFYGSLPHCNLLNAGPHLRYALFLRLYRDSHYPEGLNVANEARALTILAHPQRAWAP